MFLSIFSSIVYTILDDATLENKKQVFEWSMKPDTEYKHSGKLYYNIGNDISSKYTYHRDTPSTQLQLN